MGPVAVNQQVAGTQWICIHAEALHLNGAVRGVEDVAVSTVVVAVEHPLS